ncbi:hypothetical protein [Streptomyces sioyaensis]|uniref:hypothetical protein n=1 Tax=Streptomyces sioyaensis TaxID=67364 RepID=UPI0037161D79
MALVRSRGGAGWPGYFGSRRSLRGRLGYRVVAVGTGMAPTISGVFLRNLGGALAAQLTHQLAEQP